MQLDHTIAYDFTPDPRTGGAPPGQSRIANYGPMTGFHHRVKTHVGWLVRQPFPRMTTDSPMEQRLGRLTRAA
jgi:hypothetical protein